MLLHVIIIVAITFVEQLEKGLQREQQQQQKPKARKKDIAKSKYLQ